MVDGVSGEGRQPPQEHTSPPEMTREEFLAILARHRFIPHTPLLIPGITRDTDSLDAKVRSEIIPKMTTVYDTDRERAGFLVGRFPGLKVITKIVPGVEDPARHATIAQTDFNALYGHRAAFAKEAVRIWTAYAEGHKIYDAIADHDDRAVWRTMMDDLYPGFMAQYNNNQFVGNTIAGVPLLFSYFEKSAPEIFAGEKLTAFRRLAGEAKAIQGAVVGFHQIRDTVAYVKPYKDYTMPEREKFVDRVADLSTKAVSLFCPPSVAAINRGQIPMKI